jgi:hypothetical protein
MSWERSRKRNALLHSVEHCILRRLSSSHVHGAQFSAGANVGRYIPINEIISEMRRLHVLGTYLYSIEFASHLHGTFAMEVQPRELNFNETSCLLIWRLRKLFLVAHLNQPISKTSHIPQQSLRSQYATSFAKYPLQSALPFHHHLL